MRRGYLARVLRRVATAGAKPEMVEDDGLGAGPWWQAERDFPAWFSLSWEQREALLERYRRDTLDACDQLPLGKRGDRDVEGLAILRFYPAVNLTLEATRQLALALLRAHGLSLGAGAAGERSSAAGGPEPAAAAEALWRRGFRPRLRQALRLEEERPLRLLLHRGYGSWGGAGLGLGRLLRDHARRVKDVFGGGPTAAAGDATRAAAGSTAAAALDTDALGMLRRAHRVAVAGQSLVNALVSIYAATPAAEQEPHCQAELQFDADAGCCDHRSVVAGLLRQLRAEAASGPSLEAVEIGVGGGMTFRHVLAALEAEGLQPAQLVYTGIDPYPADASITGCLTVHSPAWVQYAGLPGPDCRKSARKIYAAAAARGHQARLLEMNGSHAVPFFEDGSLDLVFVDGLHDESVAADLLAWEPKLRPGGILVGHDFSSDWPDVPRRVLAHRCSPAAPGAAGPRRLHLGADATYWWRA